MADYTLRRIPELLWRRVKMQAAKDGITMRQAILNLLALYTK